MKIPKKIYTLPLLLAILSICSCYNNSEEELYPNTTCITENMSLAEDILPILNNYQCNSCHSAASNSGSVNIEGYTNLKIWVDNGLLLGSIKHDGTASQMPKAAAKMNQCDIDKVEAWIIQGAQDN